MENISGNRSTSSRSNAAAIRDVKMDVACHDSMIRNLYAEVLLLQGTMEEIAQRLEDMNTRITRLEMAISAIHAPSVV